MNDVRIKFYGTKQTEKRTLEVFCDDDLEIDISIEDSFSGQVQWITLNRATAIQLVKKLKLEISKINNHG
jgi:hypothetical protein